MARPSRQEILDRLVDQGRLDRDDAHAISRAPGWSFTTTELVGYVGTVVIAIGLIRLLAASDFSATTIAIALLATGSISALIAGRIEPATLVRIRLTELVEVAAVLQIAIGAGIIIDTHLIDHSELTVAILSTLATAFGLTRLRSTLVGWTISPTGTLVAATAWCAVAELDEGSTPIVFLGVSIALVALARRFAERQGALLARLAASGALVVVSMIWFSTHDGVTAAVPIVVVGACWFAFGARERLLELVIAGATMAVIGLIGWVLDSALGDVAQGLAIIAIGACTLAILATTSRRRPSAPRN